MMRFETANGLVQHYQVDGPEEAPALVFLNSLGTDFRIWDETVSALGDRYRILRYDMRGHGLTQLTPGPYTIRGLAEDALALMDKLGFGEAHLVGLSVGGMVAQQIAAMTPERVRNLVLMDTAHKIGTQDMWQARITAIRENGMASITDAVMERWFAPDFSARAPEIYAGSVAMLERIPAEGYTGICAAIGAADLTQSTSGITAKTLCLCGSEDKATPPELVLAMADLIPNARYEEIPNAGHLPCLEYPKQITDLLITHLGE